MRGHETPTRPVPLREIVRRFWPYAAPAPPLAVAQRRAGAARPGADDGRDLAVQDRRRRRAHRPRLRAVPAWSPASYVALTVGCRRSLGGAERMLSTWLSQRFLIDLRLDLLRHLQSLSIDFFTRSRLGDLLSRVSSDVSAIETFLVSGTGDTVALLLQVRAVHRRAVLPQLAAGAGLPRRDAAVRAWRRATSPAGSSGSPASGSGCRARSAASSSRRSATCCWSRRTTRASASSTGSRARRRPKYRRRDASRRGCGRSTRPRSTSSSCRDADRARRRRLPALPRPADRRCAAGVPHLPQPAVQPGARARQPGHRRVLRLGRRRAGARAVRGAAAGAGPAGRVPTCRARGRARQPAGRRRTPTREPTGRRSTTSGSTSGPARWSRSSAPAARASPRWRACCCASARPDAGAVRLDGHDLRDLTQSVAAPQRRGPAPGDAHLRRDHRRQHRVRQPRGQPGARSSPRREAADAHAFVTALPDGYDTRVGERGRRLSGGQAQRRRHRPRPAARRARAAARRAHDRAGRRAPPTGSASRCAASCRAARPLIISHNLAFTRAATSIVVLDRGRIVERGTHEELLRRRRPLRRALGAVRVRLLPRRRDSARTATALVEQEPAASPACSRRRSSHAAS